MQAELADTQRDAPFSTVGLFTSFSSLADRLRVVASMERPHAIDASRRRRRSGPKRYEGVEEGRRTKRRRSAAAPAPSASRVTRRRPGARSPRAPGGIMMEPRRSVVQNRARASRAPRRSCRAARRTRGACSSSRGRSCCCPTTSIHRRVRSSEWTSRRGEQQWNHSALRVCDHAMPEKLSGLH